MSPTNAARRRRRTRRNRGLPRAGRVCRRPRAAPGGAASPGRRRPGGRAGRSRRGAGRGRSRRAPAPLRLPAPASPAAVVPLGFPRTALGAASAAWRWTQVMYGLDPVRAAAAAAAVRRPLVSLRAGPGRADHDRGAGQPRRRRHRPGQPGVPGRHPAHGAGDRPGPRLPGGGRAHHRRPWQHRRRPAAPGTGLGAAPALDRHRGRRGDYRLLDRDRDPIRVAGLTADPDTPGGVPARLARRRPAGGGAVSCLNPLDWAGCVAQQVATSIWDTICQGFADAAADMVKGFGAFFTDATTINLASSGYATTFQLLLATGAGVAVIVLCLQVGLSVLRRDGSGVARGVTGALQAGVAAAAIVGARPGPPRRRRPAHRQHRRRVRHLRQPRHPALHGLLQRRRRPRRPAAAHLRRARHPGQPRPLPGNDRPPGGDRGARRYQPDRDGRAAR